MRTYKKPPKEVNLLLPNGFSEQFITDLQGSISIEDHGFKGEYLLDNLLSKYCDPKTTTPAIRAELATKKWLGTEQRNAKTNERIFHHDVLETDLGWTDFPTLLRVIRSFTKRILGPLRYPECLMDISHTNGASTRVKRSKIAALHKLMGEAHVTSDALKHWFACASGTTCLSEQILMLDESSVLFTVPKNSDIDRVACKEPEINMLMQRSVGLVIRRRLKKFGIDLNDQTVNQRLAASAVQDGLATIDLSSASDSISYGLVHALLPIEWFQLLDDLRVKSTIINGNLHELQMFSSMGNGFTFELESLLFYAITRAVCLLSKLSGRISVYGDDIIAPSGVVPRLIRVFHLVGFKTNEKKTFWTGTFRESCGKHYDRGFDVSPFFVRRKVSQLPDLINLLNKLVEWSCRSAGFIEDPVILSFHRKYAMYVPSYLWGGIDTGDNCSLVTGDSPRYRLTHRKKPARPIWTDEAALVHWYMVRENTEEFFSVEPTDDVMPIARRASLGWTTSWRPWFACEPGTL